MVVSASGSTPYALAVAARAREIGASVIGFANNAAAPLFEQSDVGVLLATPPEVVSGSTRMGAGTAQKIAMNMFSTLTAVKLGHVHDGLMVSVKADNEKLKKRATGIVAEIAGIDRDNASRALEHAAGSVKNAVLLATGAGTTEEADRILKAANGNLRKALGILAAEKN